MTTANDYRVAFMKYSDEINNKSKTSIRKKEAKSSLMNAGLLNKDGSAKKRIVNR